MEYKIEVYVPISFLNIIVNKIKEVGIGNLGNYKNCMSWYRVTSTWEAMENATPFIGNINEETLEEEYKIEFKCKKEFVRKVIEEIIKVHPYEEVCINIIELKDICAFK